MIEVLSSIDCWTAKEKFFAHVDIIQVNDESERMTLIEVFWSFDMLAEKEKFFVHVDVIQVTGESEEMIADRNLLVYRYVESKENPLRTCTSSQAIPAVKK